MRNTHIFSGTSCPELTQQICENLGMAVGNAELTQFANGETSVRILTSVREKDVFIVQSGSPKINDMIMELLIMISACKGGSANNITAVLPYFPYSRQSKKKSHRGAITARMLANLLHVAGVKHVVTVDLHASQMQGFFKCPVDNLHAEPIIARWIRHNIPEWKEAVVVSKNAGGTKRVTSLADALKLNFGMVTTDRRRGGAGNIHNSMTASTILGQYDNYTASSVSSTPNPSTPSIPSHSRGGSSAVNGVSARSSLQPGVPTPGSSASTSAAPSSRVVLPNGGGSVGDGGRSPSAASTREGGDGGAGVTTDGESELATDEGVEYNDERAHEVTRARLVQGHIVPDDYQSPAVSTNGSVNGALADEDPMTMSHVSSFFQPEPHALGGSGDVGNESSDDEEELPLLGKQSTVVVERTVTLVGDVRNRTVLIVDDMIDKPGSWIAAAETVVKRGMAKRVYCIATHGIFGGDCLQAMQNCDCIDGIIVTNSYPIQQAQARNITKLTVLDLSYLLAEAIRRNHYGESMSPLFQHMMD